MKLHNSKIIIVAILVLVTSILYPYTKSTGKDAKTFYEYDNNGRLKTLTNSSGDKMSFVYDSNGNLIRTALEPIGQLASPSMNANYLSNQKIKVSGWFLNKRGNAKVEIYDNNNLIDTITTFSPNEEVFKAHPRYNIHNSGFSKEYTFSNGSHSLKVIATGNDGKQTLLTSNFKVSLPVLGQLEKPTSESFYYLKEGPKRSIPIFISGWLLSDAGISSVEIFVNGVKKFDIKTLSNREDINKQHPEFGGIPSGFFDYFVVADPGKRTIELVAKTKDGQEFVQSKTIYVDYEPWIETPCQSEPQKCAK